MFAAQKGASFWRLLMLVLASSALEVVGISSIMPFLAVVADPAGTATNPYLNTVANILDPTDGTELALWLGFFSLTTLLLSNAALAFCNWKIMRLTYGLAHTVSSGLFDGYINRSFADHVQSSTADSKKNLLDEAVQIVNSATVPFIQGLSKIPVIVLILVFVLFASPALSATIFVALGLLYFLLYRALKASLDRAGSVRLTANTQRFRLAQEALDAFTDIRLFGLERTYADRYSRASHRFADALALSMTLATTPRYLFEVIAFGGILVVVLYLLRFEGSLNAALPLIMLYAVSGYRLLPAMQALLSGLAKARFAEPALDLLIGELDRLVPLPDQPAAANSERLHLRTHVSLADIEYVFPGKETPFLSSVSMVVPRHAIVGIAGSTGSGKTTLSRIILGLISPTRGEMRVDGKLIDAANLPSWQRSLGYVPQQIFISDATISQNIAFGIDAADIEHDRVVESARMANLHDFVQSLPAGYDTHVGEQGAMLSGGQRQRIAIARALYRKPTLLVLDEATSALDNATETLVMDAITKISNSCTVVIIAHRLNTLQHAKQIYVMDHGRIVDSGTFQDLVQRGRLVLGAPQVAP